MFKKFITMMMVMIMVIGSTITANAVCASEDDRPNIIGIEHIEGFIDACERLDEDGYELEYDITMVRVEGYWFVELEGWADEYYDYCAVGIYDHVPSEEEIDILWANRMLEDELCDLMDKYGF